MATRRSGLGRGLEALIPKSDDIRTGFAVIPIDRVSPNPHQPRSLFGEEALASLAASILEVGVLQPIIVREAEEGSYTLVAGERRWRAAKKVGLKEIPSIIRESDDRSLLTEALVENLQREDLSPLEEATAYQELLDDFGLTHEDVGNRVGKSRSAITNSLRLLQLPAAIQGKLERGELSAGHARALLGLEDRKFAEHIAERAVEEGWSVRQVEDAVRARNQAVGERNTGRRSVAARPAAIVELEQRLRDQMATRVRIKYANDRGKLIIDFSSLDDLERIYRQFFSA
ncbi:MAG: ParB/RepB/Spo0J family partition protein [Acidimicrobiia bacterium]|nr:ParB/RepB/Spo0J family partition protein [Acidimicrobiia bacterium]MDH3399240.1 ParB/RepB/Spo0J family partition protein [Acidimicrobiia bacterium]MDH5615585.1 ParB/RepB/Spo0J family partition protein [Acidimicrobiia bacterium]